jgi:hypothetical protein
MLNCLHILAAFSKPHHFLKSRNKNFVFHQTNFSAFFQARYRCVKSFLGLISKVVEKYSIQFLTAISAAFLSLSS